MQTKHQKSQETWAHRRWLVTPLLLDQLRAELKTSLGPGSSSASLAAPASGSGIALTLRPSVSGSEPPPCAGSEGAEDRGGGGGGGEVELRAHGKGHTRVDGIAERELAASLRAAELYSKNYNAWTHRSALDR